MNVALWVLAGLLATLFLVSGAVKLLQPKEKLVASPMGAALVDFGAGTIKVIGLLEILAAIGLILPAVTGTVPVLVPVAAVGVALLMVGAAVTHVRRREGQGVVTTLVLFAVAVLIAWGRFGGYAFPA